MATVEDADLNRIKQVIAEMARSIGLPSQEERQAAPAVTPMPCSTVSPDPALCRSRLTVATAWVRAREVRNSVFGEELFFDPAWNMLLDLYVNHARGSAVSVSSLCIAAHVPTTTALRWMTMLEQRALIERKPDPFDRRRCFVSLTPDAIARIERTLDRACDSDRKLGLGRLQTIN